MMIDKDTFDYMAAMVKLEFTEKEEKLLIDNLNKTIESIDAINNMDTEYIEPFLLVQTGRNAFREDMVAEVGSQNDMVFGAPDIQDGYFVVPRTIE